MEEQLLNPFEFFVNNQETYEEAVKKNAEENRSFSRTKHFRMDSPGIYTVRILPIAPTLINGTYQLDRRGYEYPIKTQVLKIENPKSKSKKDKTFCVNVCHTSFVGISVDLIDTYVQTVIEQYGDDEKLVKKLQSSTYENGLKYNTQRCMYIFNAKKRSEGIQMLTLSYSQYKDLEERKLLVWKKLMDKEPKHPCPISSINCAFPVEITRKEENGKTSYSFNIDTLSGRDELSEEEVKMLMDTTRIPETLYRYTKFHLEATIEFLKQYDAKMGINIMSSKKIEEAIQTIKMELPADDTSHFSFNSKEKDEENAEGDIMEKLDALWERYKNLKLNGIKDKSTEGQELREDLRQFINKANLDVRITRTKTNEDILYDIEDALATDDDSQNDEFEDDEQENGNEPENTSEKNEDEAEDEAEEQSKEEPEEEPAEQSEEEQPHARRRGEHNDDTNEPAVAATRERRAARPERRRR